MITNILVPIDGTKTANKGLKMAVSLASNFGVPLTGIHVIKSSSYSEFGGVNSDETVEEEGRRIVQEAAALADKKGVTFTSKILHGDPGYIITKVANDKKHGFDLVVLGSRGRGTVKVLFMGSVSNYVVQSAKIPVLITK